MAHNSLPHNLTEVCDAILAYLKNSNLTIDDIMKYIKGPDFPLGNTIINQKDIKTALATGHSNTSLKIRGDYVIEGNKITFNTIPYRTYRNKIKDQLEKNIDEFEKVLDDFNDESNLGVNKLVFYAKPGQINVLLNKLFKYTDLQSAVSYNMNYIVNGTPKLCSIKDLIIAYVNHQYDVMINIAKVDLEKAQAREQVIEGLLIAIKDIDTAIQLIKTSDNKEEARQKLINHFNITEIQANAILDMKLSKLTKLDKDDLLKELEELKLAITKYLKIINNESYRNEELSKKITDLKNKYGDERRTTLENITDVTKEEKEIEFVEPEKVVVVLTESGSIKRIPASSYRAQRKNGKGIKTQNDITSMVLRTNTIDQLMIFSNKGNMYRLLVDNIPVGTNSSNGTPVIALVPMEIGEKPTIVYSIYRDTKAKYVLFTTKKGLVKKTLLEEYIKTKKKAGLAAISLNEGDELVSVNLVEEENLILLTKLGMGIRIRSTDIPSSGRTTKGLKGITLKANDEVVCCLPIRDNSDDLAIFSETGNGKRINLKELPLQSRAGKGLICYKDSNITAASLVSNDDVLLVCGDKNSICVQANDITIGSRGAIGTQIIKNNHIQSVSKV